MLAANKHVPTTSLSRLVPLKPAIDMDEAFHPELPPLRPAAPASSCRLGWLPSRFPQLRSAEYGATAIRTSIAPSGPRSSDIANGRNRKDILSRKMVQGGELASAQPPSPQTAERHETCGVITSLRNSLQRDAMALALQTAAMLLMLLAALAILFPNLTFRDATQMAARDSDRGATAQPAVDLF